MPEWIDIVLGVIIRLIVGAIILHIAAGLTGISNATLGKAFTIALVGALLAAVFGLGGPIAAFIGLILVVAVTKFVYDTSWFKAVVVWIMYIVVIIVLGFILAALGYTMIRVF